MISAVAASALLSACAAAASSTQPVPSTPSAAASPPATAAAPATPGPPTPAPPVVSPCGESIERAVDTLVGRQLDAFAAGDFAAAYQLASRSFRADIGIEGFTALIAESYPEVADATEHRIVDCRQPEPGAVLAVVSVTGRNGRTVEMVYRFTLEGRAWRVDGASAPQGTSIAA